MEKRLKRLLNMTSENSQGEEISTIAVFPCKFEYRNSFWKRHEIFMFPFVTQFFNQVLIGSIVWYFQKLSCWIHYCREKQGCAPTKILVHAAKATCFASVVDLLKCQGLSKVNTFIREYFKKFNHVHNSMASVEATKSFPLKEKNSPPLVSPSKDGKSENLLAKYSTPSKVSKLQNWLDESSALGQGCHLESWAVSQLKIENIQVLAMNL